MATTAIVLAGAGARGAYEAGVLSVLVPRLREACVGDDIVVVGTSAGAINTAILAACSTPEQAVRELRELWTSVDVGDVFASMLVSAPRTVWKYVTERHLAPRLTSLLDSRPLAKTMKERLDWGLLQANLKGDGWVHSAGIVATSCATGHCVAFVQGNGLAVPPYDSGAGIEYAGTTLASAHVMASAAIPLAFRPVFIEPPEAPDALQGWYIDGGVKLNAPIKPAIALGADRVIVVATTPDPTVDNSKPVAQGEPDIFDAGAVVMHAFLVDKMADDMRALRRVNTLLSAAGDRAPSKYRLIPNLYLGPPEPGLISQAANDTFRAQYGGIGGSFSDLGFLGRVLGGTNDSHGDLLSFVFFDGKFHEELFDMGCKHAADDLGPPGAPLPWNVAAPAPMA